MINSTGARRSAVTAAATAMLLLQSCFPDYFPRRHLKEEISDEQMVGRWHLTKESAVMLDLHGLTVSSRDSTVEFFRDGRALLHDFVCGDDLITQSGTWKVEHDVAVGGGSFKKNELRITVISSDKPTVCFVDFFRKGKRLLLWQYHGDPDGRQYIEYQHE